MNCWINLSAEISSFSISVRMKSLSQSDCIVTDLIAGLDLGAEFREKASEIWVSVADSAAAHNVSADNMNDLILDRESDSVLAQQNRRWSYILTVHLLSDLRVWLTALQSVTQSSEYDEVSRLENLSQHLFNLTVKNDKNCLFRFEFR